MARVGLLILEIQLLSIRGGGQVVQHVTHLAMVGIAIGNSVIIITRA